MLVRFSSRQFLLSGVVCLIAVAVGVSQERAGVLPPVPTATPQPTVLATTAAPPAMTSCTYAEQGSPPVDFFNGAGSNTGFLNGNHNFDRFIGFLSNPVQSIDPRAVTEMWPIFSSAWASGNGPILADANAQAYGAGLYVALSDRLSFGMTQGGYGVLDINGTIGSRLAKLGLPVPERDVGGQRQGWLNLGGFAQYTLIADVPNQFLLTAGLRWEAPSGATQLFQGGNNPAYLAPYVTLGKEFGNWHVLATGGYEFPTGSGTATTHTFYLNLHIDRQIGWFYPLVEFNGSYHTSNVDLTLPTGHGVFDLGSFESSGNILTVAVGANAVLIPNKLEFGAVYQRPITAQDHFDFNGVLAKLVYRY